MTEAIYLGSKSMDWFIYDKGLRHERVEEIPETSGFALLHCLFDLDT